MPTPQERYHAAAHAMQTGVAMEINLGSRNTEPKHLRTGINTAHADIGSMALLLITKGLITEAEYLEAIADGMEREAKSYEDRLSDRYGKNITLA